MPGRSNFSGRLIDERVNLRVWDYSQRGGGGIRVRDPKSRLSANSSTSPRPAIIAAAVVRWKASLRRILI